MLIENSPVYHTHEDVVHGLLCLPLLTLIAVSVHSSDMEVTIEQGGKRRAISKARAFKTTTQQMAMPQSVYTIEVVTMCIGRWRP